MIDANPPSNSGSLESAPEAKIPLRDWLLLPLLGVLTICVVAVSSELIARQMFTLSRTGVGRCLAFNDMSAGVRGIPNCVCWEKKYESPPVEYRFNSSGFRADEDLVPKQPGTYRIVMIGSSVAMGKEVTREKTFAALLPAKLSRRTGQRIELYNEAIEGWGGTPHNIALRFNEVLDAQPDLILWILGPTDMTKLPPPDLHPETHLSRLERALRFIKGALDRERGANTIGEAFDYTRTAILLRHFLYQSQSLYVNSFTVQGDKDSWILAAGPSQAQQRLLQDFDGVAAEIEAKARAARVPFVAVFVPNHGALAAMISNDEWPVGYNPYKLDGELRSIVASHGGTYIDILPDFRNIPNPERGYFPVDGHPNPEGHAIIADLLAKELTGGAVPSLRAAAQNQVAEEQGK
jgi:hypothetical protein